MNMIGCHSCDFVTLYGKRNFAEVIKVPNYFKRERDYLDKTDPFK